MFLAIYYITIILFNNVLDPHNFLKVYLVLEVKNFFTLVKACKGYCGN